MPSYQVYYKLWGRWEYTSIFLEKNILEESSDTYFSLTYIPYGWKYTISFDRNTKTCMNKIKRMAIAGLEQKYELKKYNLKEHNKKIKFFK